jgi:hypothetical protein
MVERQVADGGDDYPDPLELAEPQTNHALAGMVTMPWREWFLAKPCPGGNGVAYSYLFFLIFLLLSLLKYKYGG